MLKTVDINCDMGEGSTALDCQQDARLMPFLTRCNIACGGHAGNTQTMQLTLEYAKQHKIVAGAHPGYADPSNFGRVSIEQPIATTVTSLLVQIDRLSTIATTSDCSLGHVKLHGALYNDAEQSPVLAEAICRALKTHFNHLTVVGLSNGAIQRAASTHQLNFLAEGFMDRAYLASGQLAPRSQEGSVYQDVNSCIEQALAIIGGQPLSAFDRAQAGPSLVIQAQTLCLHGDTAIAYALASELQQRLQDKGYQVQ